MSMSMPEETPEEVERDDELAEKLGIKQEKILDKMGQASSEGELPPALRFMEEYFPDSDAWSEKGRLDRKNMVINISSLRKIHELYPELSHEDELHDWLTHVEKRLTSVQGKSREEYKEILESLLAGLQHRGDREGDMDKSFMQKLFVADRSGEE